MKRNGFLVLLLLVVLAAAALSVWLFFFRDNGPADETPAPTHTPEGTDLPERTFEPAPIESPEPEPEETPEPTETPTPTPTPTEPPEESPEPTETPPPADASGTFSSDTGTALNLLADWSVYTDAEGNRKLEVTLSATHYALRLDSSYQALVLTVNGQSYSADCPAIAYDGSDLATTTLHTFTMNAPFGSAEIRAVWNYKGSYSGTELERITASGTADL